MNSNLANEGKKGSGRTTRMLAEAHAEAESGKGVIVVVGRTGEVGYMIRILAEFGVDVWTRSRLRARIGKGFIEFMSIENYQRGCARGFDGRIFVDHHAYEVANQVAAG
jgi:hypothetical protein